MLVAAAGRTFCTGYSEWLAASQPAGAAPAVSPVMNAAIVAWLDVLTAGKSQGGASEAALLAAGGAGGGPGRAVSILYYPLVSWQRNPICPLAGGPGDGECSI